MNKLFAVATFLVALSMLFALGASAKVQHGNIILNRIVILDQTEPVVTSVSVANDNAFDFQDGKVVLVVPELAIRASGKVDVDSGRRDTKRVALDIPPGTPSGDYWVRITVTNEDVTRIRHRIITI